MLPLLLHADKFHQVWDGCVECLLDSATKSVSPRGLVTMEHCGVTLRVNDLMENILVNTGRDLNYRFMVAEFLWIAYGLDDLATIARYNKNIAQFSDDGKILYGSYGRRLKLQWDRIRHALRKDNQTRQAVATLFNPDMSTNTKDTPCTISLQWLLRDDHLNCIATMRSSDIWLGLPYDFYVFSQLTNCLAGYLDKKPGWLQMQLGSMHLYEANFEKARECMHEWESYTLRSGYMDGLPDPDLKPILQDPTVRKALEGQEIVFDAVLKSPTKIQALGVLKKAYATEH